MHTCRACWEACGEGKRGEETACKTHAVVCTPGGRQTSCSSWVSKKLTPPTKAIRKIWILEQKYIPSFSSSVWHPPLIPPLSPSRSLLPVTQSPAPPAGHLRYCTPTLACTSSAGGRVTARLTPEHSIRTSRASVMTDVRKLKRSLLFIPLCSLFIVCVTKANHHPTRDSWFWSDLHMLVVNILS